MQDNCKLSSVRGWILWFLYQVLICSVLYFRQTHFFTCFMCSMQSTVIFAAFYIRKTHIYKRWLTVFSPYLCIWTISSMESSCTESTPLGAEALLDIPVTNGLTVYSTYLCICTMSSMESSWTESTPLGAEALLDIPVTDGRTSVSDFTISPWTVSMHYIWGTST